VLLDFGLYGWALSRFSGCWVGLKCVHDTISTAATVDADPSRMQPQRPESFDMPPGGLMPPAISKGYIAFALPMGRN